MFNIERYCYVFHSFTAMKYAQYQSNLIISFKGLSVFFFIQPLKVKPLKMQQIIGDPDILIFSLFPLLALVIFENGLCICF